METEAAAVGTQGLKRLTHGAGQKGGIGRQWGELSDEGTIVEGVGGVQSFGRYWLGWQLLRSKAWILLVVI